jgi:hypothetical protein
MLFLSMLANQELVEIVSVVQYVAHVQVACSLDVDIHRRQRAQNLSVTIFTPDLEALRLLPVQVEKVWVYLEREGERLAMAYTPQNRAISSSSPSIVYLAVPNLKALHLDVSLRSTLFCKAAASHPDL